MKKFSDLPPNYQRILRDRIGDARHELDIAQKWLKVIPDTAELVEWLQGIRGQLSVWMEEEK